MTKLRTPLTFADAMTRVAGTIGWAECVRIVGRADRSVRRWSDPDSPTVPPIDQALALDAAYVAAGGEGAPFLDAFAFQLDVRREAQEACFRALAGDLAIFSREQGDTIAAVVALFHSNPSPRDVLRAFAEGTECRDALNALLRRIEPFLPSAAGADAGQTGGNP